MSTDELDWLRNAARNRVVIEVGIWKGRSTAAMAETATMIVAVDTWPENSVESSITGNTAKDARLEAYDNLRAFGHVLIIEDRDDVRHVPRIKDGDCGLLFIDGDHSKAGVAADLLFDELVAAGGVIAGHDSNYASVREAIAERYGDAVRYGPGSIWWVAK